MEDTAPLNAEASDDNALPPATVVGINSVSCELDTVWVEPLELPDKVAIVLPEDTLVAPDGREEMAPLSADATDDTAVPLPRVVGSEGVS